MSHELESMFYVAGRTAEERERNKPWHGLGTPVEEALTSAEALKIAGLDWEVNPKKLFTEGGKEVPGFVANVRSSDESVLGVVSNKYKICQNKDAFEFTDNLIGSEVKYETAGSLFNGQKVWLLAKMPKTTILGDDVEPYLCFTNSHNGKGAIQVCCTMTRVVCNNTLNLALSNAQRCWTTRHMGDLRGKLEEAKRCLALSNAYIKEFDNFAQRAVEVKFDEKMTEDLIKKLFPIEDGMSKRQLENKQKSIQEFNECLYAVDLSQFYGTLWGVINAASDFAYHGSARRNTQTIKERRMNDVFVGNSVLDSVMSVASTLV